MRTLPHIVFGCGTVWIGAHLLNRLRPDAAQDRASDGTQLPDLVDYRFVAAGSLLPDMVDRAVRLALPSLKKEEHLVGHTLLLNLALLAIGSRPAVARSPRKALSASAGTFTHLLADPVLQSPKILLWPLLGPRFPPVSGLGPKVTMLTQITAGATILVTAISLWRAGRLRDFVTTGRL